MNKETLSRISRIVGKVARDDRLMVKTNLPVWDSTGTLTGVGLECTKKMGGIECVASATFVLNDMEQRDEAKIQAKAELAVAALKAEIIVSIKPKKKAVRAA